MKITKFLAVGLAVVAMGAAGCGDDDEPAADAITKAEWIAQADAICAAGNAEIEAAFTERLAGADPSSPEGEAALTAVLTEVAVPNIAGQVADVAALPVPEGEEEAIGAIIASAEAGVAELTADPASLNAPESPLDEATELLAAYGSEVCGEG